MGWTRRTWTKLTAVATLVLIPSVAVAHETYQEYATWENRPWGVLEHLLQASTHDLPPTPGWKCGYRHAPVAVDGAYPLLFAWIGDYRDSSLAVRDWEAELESRIPLPFDALAFQTFETEDAAHAFARQNPSQFILAFTGTYHRGPELNERMEGFACANLAVVTGHTECVEAILAHELGHNFGLRHSQEGLMRPRDVACDDRLLDNQRTDLVATFTPNVPPTIIVPLDATSDHEDGPAAPAAQT